MKKLLAFTVLGLFLSGASGCRIGECWRQAWNSRFHPQPQQTVVIADPCVVTDSCSNPCSDPCGGGMPVITPGPAPVR